MPVSERQIVSRQPLMHCGSDAGSCQRVVWALFRLLNTRITSQN
jgi:hypothetical protein